MAFTYVDRITEFVPGKRILGIKNVTRNEGFFYHRPNGTRTLSHAVLSEAGAQLGSWLAIAGSEFKKRPVLLADELTEYFGEVVAGDQLDIGVEIDSFEDDVIVTRGWVDVRGNRVLTSHCTRGYLLPLEDFADPDLVQRNFRNILRPELKDVPRLGQTNPTTIELKPLPASQPIDAFRFVDGLLDHNPYSSVTGYKNFASSEPYFTTHFPRKPIVPGVLMLTFIGELSQYLVREEPRRPAPHKALIPTFIRNVRFRKFVEPGDQVSLSVSVKEGSCRNDGETLIVSAVMSANNTRVMLAEMGFETMFRHAGSLDNG